VSDSPIQQPPSQFGLASRRVVLPDGVRPAAVLIDGEKIVGIVEGKFEQIDVPRGYGIEDLGDLVIAPGLIDAHVHINEPGRTEWEGFETATKAAAAGGITTLVDMPLNSSPVTTTVAALEAKRQAAAGKCWVDVGFYGGLVPGNADQIEPLLEAGVLGIKAFLCHSGLDEFPATTEADLRTAAPHLVRHQRPLLVHAELTNAPAPRPEVARKYSDYLATRPLQWEWDAINLLCDVCKATGCPIHIVHLANGPAAGFIERLKRDGLPITVETCPHYLHFAAENVPDGDTRFKCAPPIRESLHRDLLWDGLARGVIDTIGSDHSPCPPEMKQLESGNFMAAWGGIASLQLTLPIVWTECLARKISVEQMFRWLSANPAKLVGLAARKGRLAAGCDADLIVWNPETTWTVRGANLQHRHKLTPYEGAEVRGGVKRTYLRGNLIFEENEFVGHQLGELLVPDRSQPSSPASIGEHLNPLAEDALRAELTKCCASERWVDRMVVERPYTINNQFFLRDAADFWWCMDREDWLEAFAAHPKIGDVESLRAKFGNTRGWASGEQAGVAGAAETTLQRLSQLNREYEAKFGYIFIVYATGKTADEMLAILESRLPNDPETELKIAAGEQLKITQLRLQKLVL
jgi:allantoinase